MRKQKSIAEARSTLPTLIRDAEGGEAIELTRRGESVAVLLGRKQYQRLAAGTMRFSEAWDAFLAGNDLTELDIDPDEIFAGVRDASPGRDSGL